MEFGYCRVSTKRQCERRQIDALREAGIADENIYRDVESGAKANRKGLEDLLGHLRRGDSVTVLSFDRLARSTSQLLNLIERFQEEGVDFISLHDHLDTRDPRDKLFFTISAAFAEFERAMIRERQREGIESAKAAGRRLGRRPMSKEKIDTAITLHDSGKYTVKECCEKAGISESVYYRYRRSLEEKAS